MGQSPPGGGNDLILDGFVLAGIEFFGKVLADDFASGGADFGFDDLIGIGRAKIIEYITDLVLDGIIAERQVYLAPLAVPVKDLHGFKSLLEADVVDIHLVPGSHDVETQVKNPVFDQVFAKWAEYNLFVFSQDGIVSGSDLGFNETVLKVIGSKSDTVLIPSVEICIPL